MNFIIVPGTPMTACLGLVAALLLAAPSPVAAPAGVAAEASRARHLMGTRCVVTVLDPQADRAGRLAADSLDAIAGVEERLSTWRPESELSRANAAAGAGEARLSPALASDLAAALQLARETGGAFDPTVGPLVGAWDLRGPGRIPPASELVELRTRVGHERVGLHGDRLRLPPGAWLEAGAFGKGLALDEAARGLSAAGVSAALLDFGGQFLALGAPAGESAWRLAIADPRDRRRAAVVLKLRDASVATSAQSERARDVQGRSLGHVLDPRSGLPVDRRGSASVIAASGLEADAWATALLVLGPDSLAGLGRPALFLEPVDDRLVLHANSAGSALVLDTAADVRFEIHR